MQPQSIVAQQPTPAAQPDDAGTVTYWRLTLKGAMAAATDALEQYIADPTCAGAATMDARYSLAHRIAERGGK